MPLLLKCAAQAPDGAARNSALSLIAATARRLPDQAVDYVLQVVDVVAEAREGGGDHASGEVLVAAFRSLLPAWTASQQPLSTLLSRLLPSLASWREATRLALLSSLLQELPKDEALPYLLYQLLMLEQELAPALHQGPKPLKGAKVGRFKGIGWPGQLAHALAHQVGAVDRVQCMPGLLKLAADSSTAVAALQPVIAFVARLLQEVGEGVETKGSPEIGTACASLLQQGLSLLQVVGKGGVKDANTGKEARAEVEHLLEALRSLMTKPAFLSALVHIVGTEKASLARPAIRVFTSAVGRVREEGFGRDAQVVEAALGMCPLLAGMLRAPAGEPPGPAARQLAMAGISELAVSFGAQRPEPFLALLESLELAMSAPGPRLLQCNALACLAHVVGSLGRRAIPALPSVIPAILIAASATVFRLPVEDPASASEELLVEAGAVIAAMGVLIKGQGAMLSPHLNKLLALVLDPRVLACPVASVGPAARQLAADLAAIIPPRLLLPALDSIFPAALADGAAPAVGVLQIAERMVSRMDAAAADAVVEQLFGLVRRALDVRREARLGDPADVAAVEAAAGAVLVATTLKLKDARFKPLFLALLEWAAKPHPEGSPLARKVAFIKVVGALTARLRTLFVPYFRYVLPLALEALGGAEEALEALGTDTADEAPRKKRKSKRKSAAEGTPAHADEAKLSWLLRFQVLEVLRRVFQHDKGVLLEETTFQRILPPLVLQLEGEPPGDWRPETFDAVTAGGPAAVSSGTVDPYADAVVEALVQMAVTAASDHLIKPLHHEVLMATRKQGAVQRRAVRVLEGLVERLGQEYSSPALMPEALPFVGELLEDPSPAIAEAAKRLVSRMKDLSGEDLDDYLKP
eukprot:jgi/Botrbrau1/2741/Bobra.0164s0021.1